MENVGAVLMNEHAGLVKAVVGVAAHMVPPLQHQHALAAALSQLPGGHGAGHARTDDQTIISLIHWDLPSL